MPIKTWYVNVYYLIDGEQKVIYNACLSQAAITMRSIIRAGGEITGIIESEKDN